MARVIRFPLKMKNGAEVRSLDELKENFDLESVLGYFANGKLKTWLEDRYFDEKAEAVGALSSGMSDLNAKLCEILEVEYKAETTSIDLEVIQRRNQKLKILSTVTDDQEILRNVDIVAFNTPEINDNIYDILRTGTNKIYLYGEEFKIPAPPSSETSLRYIGINKPLVTFINGLDLVSYEEEGISFKNVKFESNINPWLTKGERLFIEGKHKDAYPLILEAANNGNPRAMYLMARYLNDGYDVVSIDIKERNTWCQKAFQYNEPLSMFVYANWGIEKDDKKKQEIYSHVLSKINEMADNRDCISQLFLGFIYNVGAGVNKDYNESFKRYVKVAEQGLARAQSNLGSMYRDGVGVNHDDAMAVEWYRKAAEQGFVHAQGNLGFMYENGRGVTQDYTKAVEWYRKAADQGNAYGQNNLGLMYQNGKGVNQDDAQAVEWYRKAAKQDFANAQNNLGWMYLNGRGVNQDYSMAVEWCRKAAEQGNALGQCNLGFMYDTGRGVIQDKNKAIEWYRKSAEQGNETAKNNLKILGVAL